MNVIESSAEVELSDLVTELVIALTHQPGKVQVKTLREDGLVRIDVMAGAGQLGRLIGRNGVTAQALRRILAVAATKYDVRCELNFSEANAVERAGK